MPIEIGNDNFASEVESSSTPVILDVFATWCGPCMATKPHFEGLEKDYDGKVKFATLNIEEARDIAIKFGVTSIPAFLLFKDGELVNRDTGQKSKDDLKVLIDGTFNR